MKPIYLQAGSAVALTFAIAACIPSPKPAPTPSPVATTPTPAPAPPPVATQPSFENWMDAPQTRGDWKYGASGGETYARFGEGGETVFALQCRPSSRSVELLRYGAVTSRSGPLTVRTETVDRTLNAQPGGGSGTLAAALQARDPLLDAMALSKGRFAIEAQGLPTLYLPAWAEVTRVIEDCR